MQNVKFKGLCLRTAFSTQKGFSLIELLLVLLLIGIGTFIAVPSLDRGLKERVVKQSALGLAATARDLRSKAIYGGFPHRLILDSLEKSYQSVPGQKIFLPPDVMFSGVTGGEPLTSDSRQFFFFPNGSVLGGEIRLAREEGRSTYVITLNPLSGRVGVRPSQP
jgi:general secretion pathway protein H